MALALVRAVRDAVEVPANPADIGSIFFKLKWFRVSPGLSTIALFLLTSSPKNLIIKT
jgi:hypothetical protein